MKRYRVNRMVNRVSFRHDQFEFWRGTPRNQMRNREVSGSSIGDDVQCTGAGPAKSIVLYAVEPLIVIYWVLRRLLRCKSSKLQKRYAFRVRPAYRKGSAEEVLVVVGLVPFDFRADEKGESEILLCSENGHRREIRVGESAATMSMF